MTFKRLNISLDMTERKKKRRMLEETGALGERERERHAGAVIEKRHEEVFVWRSCYLSDCATWRQEMVLLHTGNELMAAIRRENGSGNQNKFMPTQQRGRLWRPDWGN